MHKLITNFALAAVAWSISHAVHATADPVRICAFFNEPGWYYIPETDICLNTATGETRQLTAYGTWRSLGTNTPGNWLAMPKVECIGGKLLKIGNFTSNDFRINDHGKYETAPINLALRPSEFISKVMIRGGFDVTSTSRFCLSYMDSLGEYSVPLGCENTAQSMNQPAVFSFTPLLPLPPSTLTRPITLIGNSGNSGEIGNDSWGTADSNGHPPIFNGSLTSWICVDKAKP